MATDDICIVVDEHDQIIEYRKRSTLTTKERWRDSIVFLVNDAGDILLAQRHPKKRIMGGKWASSASGTVESHETYHENAVKELYEELGLRDIPLTFVGNFCVNYGPYKRMSGVFVGTYNGELDDLVLEKDQVAAVKWISPADLQHDLDNNNPEYAVDLEKMLAAAHLLPNTKIEYAHVVDTDNNLLVYRSRSDCSENNETMRIVAIWIEDEQGNVLIHKRSAQKKSWPNIWENAAAGGIASFETPEEAAYKELSEEIGLTDIELKPVQILLVETPSGKRLVHWYRGSTSTAISELTLAPDEVAEAKWVNKNALLDDRDATPELYMPSSAHWRTLFS